MRTVLHLLISTVLLVLTSHVYAQDNLSEILVTKDGFAIQGYDPVAYFSEGKPVKGNTEIVVNWKGATWLFSSVDNKQSFINDPEKYAPQYGGWCAYGVAEGYAAETDPVNGWTVHNGKLYLNWDAEVSKEWSADIPGFLKKSEPKWVNVKEQLKNGEATIYWHEDDS